MSSATVNVARGTSSCAGTVSVEARRLIVQYIALRVGLHSVGEGNLESQPLIGSGGGARTMKALPSTNRVVRRLVHVSARD